MRSLAAALALTLLAATASAYDKKALEEHIRESYQLPSEVSLAFGEAKGSDVPGFDAIPLTLTFNGRSQNETLFLSKNDRHYILGGFKDLKVLPSQERIKKMDLRTAPMRGKADAPVSVVQYTDFQCPFCERGYTIMRDKILKEFEGKVKWYYKALPLGFHDWAEPAAVAVECVKTQGVDKFWTMHDELFDKQGDITAADFDEMKQLAEAGEIGIVAAPNFALGAVLMMHLAKIAGKFLDHAEIIELHHDRKLDAPSGTALLTARAMAEARGKPFLPPAAGEPTPSRGQAVEGISLHSVRLPGLMAHQEVIFGAAGQTLSIRHDTINRECYMPGVMLAVRAVVERKGFIYGLDKLLGL